MDDSILDAIRVNFNLNGIAINEAPKFQDIQQFASSFLGRNLKTEERNEISKLLKTIKSYSRTENELEQNIDGIYEDNISTLKNVLIISSYSKDYSIGRLSESINRAYADKHGYIFHCDEINYSDMLADIAPRSHCTWYKVLMLLRYLSNETFLNDMKIGYIMWIDSDAIFANHNLKIERVIEYASYRDLILAENMTKGNLLNAGVLLVKNSDWSRSLWAEVWHSKASARYHHVYFYEQSALTRCLRLRGLGLEDILPFHTHCDGPYEKFFPHVAVLCHLDFNSNAIMSPTYVTDNCSPHSVPQEPLWDNMMSSKLEARFIFHAVGQWNKLQVLQTVISQRNLPRIERCPGYSAVTEFSLFRGKCGSVPTSESVEARTKYGRADEKEGGERDKPEMSLDSV